MKLKFIVIKSHVSEYPNPISFSKGTVLAIGEKYEGEDGWNDWYFCSVGHQSGWVPKQCIEWIDDHTGIGTVDYTAQELNVTPGEVVTATKECNGWFWCQKVSSEEGWIPALNLKLLD